jgi:putative transposase
MKERSDISKDDQANGFASEAFNGQLKENGIDISMDGKDSWRDNAFVEGIGKSIKYEEAYLHAYETVQRARISIGRYLEFYYSVGPQSSLKANTPIRAASTACQTPWQPNQKNKEPQPENGGTPSKQLGPPLILRWGSAE